MWLKPFLIGTHSFLCHVLTTNRLTLHILYFSGKHERMLHTFASQKSGCLYLRTRPNVRESLEVGTQYVFCVKFGPSIVMWEIRLDIGHFWKDKFTIHLSNRLLHVCCCVACIRWHTVTSSCNSNSALNSKALVSLSFYPFIFTSLPHHMSCISYNIRII